MSFMRQVVLVDERDNELGTAEIERAHQGEGLKHRALSVMLYRKRENKVEWLLQRRAMSKPVFAGIWGNTCCTNLRPSDEYLPRAASRLKEEMGIKIEENDLHVLYRFSYRADDPNRPGWCENELDTVIVGEWGGEVKPNPEEVSEYKWVDWEELQKDVAQNDKIYAPWLSIIIESDQLQRVEK
jgi:isopentenyl-diphosphate delta-isomerase